MRIFGIFIIIKLYKTFMTPHFCFLIRHSWLPMSHKSYWQRLHVTLMSTALFGWSKWSQKSFFISWGTFWGHMIHLAILYHTNMVNIDWRRHISCKWQDVYRLPDRHTVMQCSINNMTISAIQCLSWSWYCLHYVNNVNTSDGSTTANLRLRV